jgi:hypothetical protein
LAARELGRISFLDDLNWNNWDQTSRRDCTIEALNWCHARGISVRARGLMIPIWKLMPFEMRNIQNRPNLLRRWLEELARERVAAASGRVQVWDVVQEPIDQQEIFKVVGDRVVADWLKIARQEDSQALLAVNVSGLINFNGRDSERFERWSALRQLWKEKGAPLDQLGIQAKFWEGSETSPDRLWEILDQLSVDGMSLELTELEVASRNKAAAAAYLKDVLLLAFSHPAVKGITVDGFWLDGRVRPGNNLYTKEGLPTQLGQAWLDLIWGEWATKVAGLTTSAGEFEWRGFPGIYRVEFAGGKTMEVELKPGATVEISPESGNNP